MTLIYAPRIGLYLGWEKAFAARKLNFCRTKASISASWREFELIWEWSTDPPLTTARHAIRPTSE